MIFLTVGSWHRGFDRLIKAVDEFKRQGIITEEVNTQIGEGKYKPTNMKAQEYYSPDEFVKAISRARIVIAHAGMGAIIEATRQGIPIIVVPRKAKLGEANDDHQFDTAKALEQESKILVAHETKDIPCKLKEAETFVPSQRKDSQQIIDEIQVFIDNVIAKKFS